jgi:ankyrin repeat protein
LAGADEALAVAVDTQGAVLVAGGNQGTEAAGPAAFVRKLDPAGVALWEQRFPGSGRIAGIAVDGAGAITAVGAFVGRLALGEIVLESKSARSDLFIARLTPQGRVAWANRYGSAAYEAASAVVVDGGGNCYVTGTYQQDLDFGLGSLDNRLVYDIFVVKLDPGGKAMWNQGFHAAGGTETTGLALALAPNGDVLVAGRVQGAADFGRGFSTPHRGSADAFVARLSADGKPLGGKRFGGRDAAEANAIAVDRHGDVVLTGAFRSDLRVDGGTTLKSAGSRDVFVLALDGAFAPRWSKRFGGTGADATRAVGVDGQQHVFVAGGFAGDLGLGDGAPVGPGGSDGFLSAFDSRGGHLFTVRLASAADDEIRAVALDREGEPVVAGTFGGAVEPAGLVPVGRRTGFAAKVAAQRVPAAEVRAASVRPSPAVASPPAAAAAQDLTLAVSACERGDLPLLRSLVPGRVPVSATRADGWSLLYIAAYKGKADLVRYLLEHKADPNGKGGRGYTSLHQAARWGYVDTVAALLAGGADVNAGDGSRIGTPLHVAIDEARGDAELAKLLLSHGARTDARGDRGRTPLMLAVSNKRDDVVDALLAAQADVNATDETKNSVLAWAAISDNPSAALKLLGQRAKVDEPNDSRMTPLFHAAHGGTTAIVAALLERGARPDCVESKYGSSALMRAANNGHLPSVKLLVERKAKLELENHEGLTAFMMAARNGNRDVVAFLLSRKANARHKDKHGNDALDLAKRQNQRAMVTYLEQILGKRK